MSNNLIALALQYLTPDVIARIASTLGLGRSTVEKAISAAVPALFGTLASTAEKPDGARRLASAIKGLDPDLTSDLGRAFTAGKQEALLDSGKSILSSLLGGESDALSHAVAKFGGLDSGAASGILAAVAPMVLGAIKSNSSSLDGGSLAGLLAGQKNNIAAALPPGLLSSLTGSGLVDRLGNVGRDTRQAAERASNSVTSAQAKSNLSKLAWIIPLIAVAVLAWYFIRKPGEKPVAPPVPDVVQIDGVDLGKEVSAITDSLKTSLGGITDTATAQTALPQLTEITGRVDKLTELSGKLTTDQKKIVAGLVTAILPTLTALADKALALPGVGDIIKPTLDGLRTKLEALARA